MSEWESRQNVGDDAAGIVAGLSEVAARYGYEASAVARFAPGTGGGEPDVLAGAVRYLADRCDGAVEEDGMGFNRFDAPLGRSLAGEDPAGWSTRQRRAAWRMLRKYRGQLGDAGVDYSAIPEPPVPEKTDADEFRHRVYAPESGGFTVAFSGYEPALVSKVKDIPGRRFDGAERVWRIPERGDALEPLVRFIAGSGIDYSEVVVERVERLAERAEAEAAERAERREASRAASADIEVEGLGGVLRPFQEAGVAYALRAQRCFVADEMGLGKTVEALATLQTAGAFPALVICPASLKLNWAREARTWLPGRSVTVMGGKGSKHDPQADVTVINYDVLTRHADALKARGFGALILDESHYIKNHRARRTKLCTELAAGARVRLLLSGTPLLNEPAELIAQLGVLERLGDFGGFWSFVKRYCNPRGSSFLARPEGASNLEELNRRLRETCYVRRTKAEVLKELPPKQRSVVPVSLDNEKEYRRAERDVVRFVGEVAERDREKVAAAVAEYEAEHGEKPDGEARRRILAEIRSDAEWRARNAEQLVRIEALKQTAARGKLEQVARWIENFLSSGEKLVVFANHREIVDALAERFGAPSITGDTPAERRQEAVDAFQDDPDVGLIVLNIQAGGVGITLTAASNVAFVELAWNPAAHDQAEDRCHRIGQEAGSVNAWYLLAQNTIDQEIHDLIERKRAVVDAATEGGGEVPEEASVLSDLKKLLREKSEGDEGKEG